MSGYWKEMSRAIRGGLRRKGLPETAEALHRIIHDEELSAHESRRDDIKRTLEGNVSKPTLKLARIARRLDLPLTELIELCELGQARKKLAKDTLSDADRKTFEWVAQQIVARSFTSLDPPPEAGHRSLLDWNTGGLDVRAVFVGDRRHKRRPASVADILAGDASPRDVQDMLRLGLSNDARIYVDRIAVLAPEPVRRELFDSDLMTIGSGMVNIVTMLCQGRSTFELAIDDTIGEEVADHLQVLRDEYDSTRLKDLYAAGAPPIHPEVKLDLTATQIREAFGQRTFRDIFAPDGVRRPRARVGEHLGVVALAPWPWRDEEGNADASNRVTVLVYGTSVWATYAGLVALVDRDDDGQLLLGRRPLGGVYYVGSNADRPSYLWNRGVRPTWLTGEYTIDNYLERLKTAPVEDSYRQSISEFITRLER